MSETNDYINELRTKYKTLGIDVLSETEVLELLLSYGMSKNIRNVADSLMNRFGSLYCIFERTPQTLMETSGITMHAAILLNMQSSLFRVCSIKKELAAVNKLTSETCEPLIRSLFIGHNTEQFYAISLNSTNNIISIDLLSTGTINRANVYTRQVIELAFNKGAEKMLFVHNHPNGVAIPSATDIQITYNLHDALKAVSIGFEDHIIVTDSEIISLKNDMHIFDSHHAPFDAKVVIEEI